MTNRGEQAGPMGHRPEAMQQSAARGQQAKGGGQRVQAGRVQSMRLAAEGRGQRAKGRGQLNGQGRN